jgi:hypothetical protein
MSDPTVIAVHARPFQVAHLSFEVGGILEGPLEGPPVELGTPVRAFDFPAFYAILGVAKTVPGTPSQLLFDFMKIKAEVAPFALGCLRNEARKAAMHNAINARQNAYFAKYVNAPDIIKFMNEFYSPTAPGSKPQRLHHLSTLAQDQWDLLQSAYDGLGRTGVVTNTISTLCSETTNYGYSATSGINDAFVVTAPDTPITIPTLAPPDPPAPWPTPREWPLGCLEPDPNAPPSQDPPAPSQPPTAAVNTWGEGFTGDGKTTSTIQKGTSYQTVSSGDKAHQTQTVVNTDYVYRVPYHEGLAQLDRAKISLIDQQFAQYMYGQNLPNLAQVFQNELKNIDSNVFRLQIAVLDTILLSPIAGIVTGIYKNPGDAVRPGEPVLRVEDNTSIYLVATIVHRGPIVVAQPLKPPPANSQVTIQTSLFDVAGPLSPSLTGTVVSARGHRGGGDMWDLIVKCQNPVDASGNPIIPLGYHFDFDNTSISIS